MLTDQQTQSPYSQGYRPERASRRRAPLTENAEGMLRGAFHLITPFLQGWRDRWGATPGEVAMRLPGDEIVPDPRYHYTHAITIKAAVAQVWPWLVQLGQGKAGYYSYQGLENLAKCEIYNVYEIRPAWQDVKPGDVVRMSAQPTLPSFPVAQVIPNRVLVLGAPPKVSAGETGVSWVFYLHEVGPSETRLIVRWRIWFAAGWQNWLSYGPALTGALSFVMETKTMETIKRLAEGDRVS